MIAITARFKQRDLGSTLKEIQQKIKSQVVLPVGYSIEYGGAYAEQQKAFSETPFNIDKLCVSCFCSYTFLFRNIKVSLLIILIAVLGVAGSFIALFLTGTPLNVGSYTGIIMIVGIIGENPSLHFCNTGMRG